MVISPAFSNLLPPRKQVMSNLEIWKAIPSAHLYEVSNFGRARSLPRTIPTHHGTRTTKLKLLSLRDNGKGYKFISTCLYKQKEKHYLVHRLVAILFIPNPNVLPEVNHKDANKGNNHVNNLEWVTLQDNRDHAVANDLIHSGEDAPNVKLTLQGVIKIRQTMTDNPNQNICALARSYGVQGTTIQKIIRGQRWKRTLEKWDKIHNRGNN